MKHLCVVEDAVFTFTCVWESFISHLLMSGPVDRMPGRSLSTSGLILPKRNEVNMLQGSSVMQTKEL